jgi:hypothetical protein
LTNYLNTQTTQDNAQAAADATNAQQAATDAANAINTAATNTAAPITALFNNDVNATEAYNSDLQSILSAIGTGNLGNLTAEQQEEIGLNPEILTALAEYPQIFPTQSTANMPSPALYYSGPQSAILPSSPSQVETPEQAAAIAALNDLNGNPLAALNGLTGTAPTTPYEVPTDLGQYNNVGLGDFLYNNLEPMYLQYQQIPFGTPAVGNNADEINSYMQMLAQLTNQSIPQPTPVTGPSGPPYVGPPTNQPGTA